MTELLERAIARLQTLSESEQNAIASIILEEIEDERLWDESFSRSPNVLAELAASAMAEYHAGETQELDPETL
jgi:aspartate/glutamate racemase